MCFSFGALQYLRTFLVNFMSMNLALGFHSITYNNDDAAADDDDDDDNYSGGGGLAVDRNHNSKSILLMRFRIGLRDKNTCLYTHFG